MPSGLRSIPFSLLSEASVAELRRFEDYVRQPLELGPSVTGIDPFLLGAMVGRQLPFFSLIVPFWLIWAFAGFRGMKDIWPAILITGVSFAIPQFLISNFINPWIVDIGASLISMACLILFLKVWQPPPSPPVTSPIRIHPRSQREVLASLHCSQSTHAAADGVRPVHRYPSFDCRWWQLGFIGGHPYKSLF